MKINTYSHTGAKLKTKTELPKEIFGIEPSLPTLRQYISTYLANQRLGSAKAKTRAQVSGGGRKPWPQKGTGRARHGSIRSPLWVGGGKAHGPQPKNWFKAMPKPMRRLALLSALAIKAKAGKILVVNDIKFKEGKTKEAKEVLESMQIEGKRVLVVIGKQDEKLQRAFRNIPYVLVRHARNLNAYEISMAHFLVLTKEALENL